MFNVLIGILKMCIHNLCVAGKHERLQVKDDKETNRQLANSARGFQYNHYKITHSVRVHFKTAKSVSEYTISYHKTGSMTGCIYERLLFM
jgi:hypothetical protein